MCAIKLFIGHIEIYPEMCCEICGEIIHNHIDCPVCGKKYAETDNYYGLYESPEDPLVCECGAKFKLVSGSHYYDGEWAQIIEEVD